jgi:EAL domain-containing protein (putative c-di-GMP-specific phosphodiesterase class I)
MALVDVPDYRQELVNATINIQAIVNILASKGMISEQEWQTARQLAVAQLQGKFGYEPPTPQPLGMPR